MHPLCATWVNSDSNAADKAGRELSITIGDWQDTKLLQQIEFLETAPVLHDPGAGDAPDFLAHDRDSSPGRRDSG